MTARPPDWLIGLGVVGALIGAAIVLPFWLRDSAAAGGGQAAPPSSSHATPATSLLDPTITVDVPSGAGPGAGTAFSISAGGMWMTARHVVEGCAHTAIVVGPGQGVAAEVRIDPHGETAVLITQGGAPALPIAPRDSLRHGMTAFHAGFPQGHPGQVSSRLLRRETLVLRGRRTRHESVLAWSESDDEGPIPPSLAGLSGAPALDSQGRVIGVTIAQSRRHGQIYTTTPTALRMAIIRAHIEPATGARAAPMSPGSYSRISAVLRGNLRIVPVVCLAG